MAYTIEELEKETCQSFGGNNCVLHQCMFGCVLNDAKEKVKKQKESATVGNNTQEKFDRK